MEASAPKRIKDKGDLKAKFYLKNKLFLLNKKQRRLNNVKKWLNSINLLKKAIAIPFKPILHNSRKQTQRMPSWANAEIVKKNLALTQHARWRGLTQKKDNGPIKHKRAAGLAGSGWLNKAPSMRATQTNNKSPRYGFSKKVYNQNISNKYLPDERHTWAQNNKSKFKTNLGAKTSEVDPVIIKKNLHFTSDNITLPTLHGAGVVKSGPKNLS